MKIKKLWIAAASFGVSASLLATVLTACSADDIDDDQKITLDSEGKLVGGNDIFNNVTYKTAIKNALKRSSTWATFKQALADELVYQWYVDRAAKTEDESGDKAKNVDFRLNLNKWDYDVKEAYKDTVQSCKDKYGQNYKFYLQNEYLSPNGGTEDSYKHAELVKKAKEEFISKVWANNYFGWSKDTSTTVMPRYFADASMTIDDQELLANPKTWDQLGFFATVNPEYAFESKPEKIEDVDTAFLARNPDGDYATIQDYVFNRWFETERPFFSAASLFKYSAPKYVGGGKLDGIYSSTSLGVTLPDAPNETYPFFGGVEMSKQGVGTRAYLQWFQNAENGKFFTSYKDVNAGVSNLYPSNGTVTIPADNTEDSQTLLLSFGSQMIGGSSALYPPYASAAANLYLDMVLDTPITNSRMNTVHVEWLRRGLNHYDSETGTWVPYTMADCYHDNVTSILHTFFIPGSNTQLVGNQLTIKLDGFVPTPTTLTKYGDLNSYVDIQKLYGGIVDEGTNYFHSKLFKSTFYDDEFDFFFGRTGINAKDGIRYIVNTVRVDDLVSTRDGHNETQPWILELNETGMHAQTIDGYAYVKNPTAYGSSSTTTTKQALMNVVKYRLMQKKCKFNDSLISADVFGDNGALKTYFTNNFADIILEIALKDDATNIFRKNEDYNKTISADQETLFEVLCSTEGFTFANIADYIKTTSTYDLRSKYVDECVKANDTIFAYRKDQVTNSKFTNAFGEIYKNGLLAPIAYDSSTITNSSTTDVGRTHEYCVSPITYIVWDDTTSKYVIDPTMSYSGSSGLAGLKTGLDQKIDQFDWESITVDNTEQPWSPQIKKAKEAQSNRFWYKSAIVDKAMYSAMGNAETLATQIKVDSYQKFIDTNITQADLEAKFLNNVSFQNAMASTWSASQLFTADKNFSSYFGKVLSPGQTFFNLVKDAEANKRKIEEGKNGLYNSESVSYKLFLATLVYLTMDTGTAEKPEPCGNFYKILNSQIGEDEAAFVGYVNKVNTLLEETDYKAPTYFIGEATAPTVYDWTPDVANIYDQIGYTKNTTAEFKNSKVASDQYWNVVSKQFSSNITKTLAGFTGLQTKSSNSLDECIKTVPFDLIAKYTSGSRNLAESTSTEAVRYEPNTGAWFAFAGGKDAKGDIHFPEFKYTDTEGTHIIKDTDFTTIVVEGKTYDTSVCLRLAKKMVNYSSMQDLKTLAKNLGDSYYGDSVYRQIGSGERSFTDINEMKYVMLKELPRVEDGQLKNKDFYKCFERLTNVEVHEEGQDEGATYKYSYCFDDKNGNGYKLMLTQVNKADVVEKRLAPEWKNGAWDMSNCPITLDEFFYLLCDSACESSVQSLAITQVVKTVFGDEKLKVYDANLYNAFDSIWIKDWVKKPIGA